MRRDRSHLKARTPANHPALPKVGDPVAFYSTRGVLKHGVVVEVLPNSNAVKVRATRRDGPTWTGWRKWPQDFTEEGAAARRRARAELRAEIGRFLDRRFPAKKPNTPRGGADGNSPTG